MHVFYLQGSLHQQFYRDSWISNCPRDCTGTADGCKLLRLLENKNVTYNPKDVKLLYLTTCIINKWLQNGVAFMSDNSHQNLFF